MANVTGVERYLVVLLRKAIVVLKRESIPHSEIPRINCLIYHTSSAIINHRLFEGDWGAGLLALLTLGVLDKTVDSVREDESVVSNSFVPLSSRGRRWSPLHRDANINPFRDCEWTTYSSNSETVSLSLVSYSGRPG